MLYDRSGGYMMIVFMWNTARELSAGARLFTCTTLTNEILSRTFLPDIRRALEGLE
jgi:hypothetical protein